MNLNPTAIIATVLSILAIVTTALGKPALAAVFNDPNTANVLTGVVGVVSSIIAGFSAAAVTKKSS